MVEGGMPPLEAIRAATLYGATVMGLEKQLGTVEPGTAADSVAAAITWLDGLLGERRRLAAAEDRT